MSQKTVGYSRVNQTFYQNKQAIAMPQQANNQSSFYSDRFIDGCPAGGSKFDKGTKKKKS